MEHLNETGADGPAEERKERVARPSYFAAQGRPDCSIWGKTEMELLAWVYVTAQSRNGNTWAPVSPELAYALLTPDERRNTIPRLPVVMDVFGALWERVAFMLTSADMAFKVGGLSWHPQRFLNREGGQEETQEELRAHLATKVGAPDGVHVSVFEKEGFIASAVPSDVHVNYILSELHGIDEEGEIIIEAGNGNPTDKLGDGQIYLSGAVKWDGCSNWRFDEQDHVSLHACSKQDLLDLGIVMGRCWDWTPLLMPKFDTQIANNK